MPLTGQSGGDRIGYRLSKEAESVLAAVSGSVGAQWRSLSRVELLPLFARRTFSARAVVASGGSGIPYRPFVSAGAQTQCDVVACLRSALASVGSLWSFPASSSAAGSRAIRRVPRFAPAAVAANKSLKPTPLRRFVEPAYSSGIIGSGKHAQRRGLALVLGVTWNWMAA